MKKLLLLHYRADCNTNDIWRAAVRAGWSTDRVHDHFDIDWSKFASVRYYGNTMHGGRIAPNLPVSFDPLDLTVLAKTCWAKRRIELVEMGKLIHSEQKFIKPAQEKWFPAKVYEVGEFPPENTGGLMTDLIYAQTPLRMVNEVRCFCLDGKVHTASYYRISQEYCPLGLDEVDRTKEIDEMVEKLAPSYPRGVVLDFAYTERGDWCFIEPNEAWASGIYGCDPTKCLDVIEASQTPKP
jgi:hypothetical protein